MPHDRLSVMHCLRAPVGGLFRHVYDLMRGQQAHGIRVGLICDAGGDLATEGALAELAPVCALGIHRVPMGRTPAWSDAGVARRIARICGAHGPRILHGHGAKGGAYARLVARAVGARSIYTPHGGSLHYAPTSAAGLLYLGIERSLKHRTDGLLFECEFSAATYARRIGAPSCPSQVVRNGLHATEFRALDPTSPAYDFVFVGEFRKLKGLEVLLQALARLRRPVRVLAAGAGPHAAWFRRAARALAPALTLAPPIHPATRAFSQARCVVIPSLAESFPYVVLEAAAARMPLLATRVGGIPEIFGPYGDHLLPPGDAAALAAAMAAFLDRPAERGALAGKLQEHVRGHFGVERMVQDNIAFCRRVAGTD